MWRKLRDAWARRSYENLIRRYEQLAIIQQQDEWRKMVIRRKLIKTGALATLEARLRQADPKEQAQLIESLKSLGIKEKDGRLIVKEDRPRTL